MKKTLLKNAILMLTIFLASCGKDDPKPATPSLSFSSTQIVDGTFKGVYYASVIAPAYGKLKVDFSGTVPNGFSKLTISKTISGTPQVIETIEQPSVQITANGFTYSYTYNVQAGDINNDVVLQAEITDKKNLTTVLTVANLDIKRAAKKFELAMDADDIVNDVADKEYYLLIQPMNEGGVAMIGESASVQLRSQLGASKLYSNVQLIFDFTPGLISPTSGPYLGSPQAVGLLNAKLTEGFTTKNSTTIKIAEYSSLSSADALKLQDLAYANPHAFEEVFDHIPAGSNSQLVYLNKTSEYFVMFKLADGRVGYMDNLVYGPEKIRIGFDLWISAK